MSTPPSLLERLRRPGDDAWGKFVDMYTPLLFYWAKRMGESEVDAADLVQEVLMHLLRKMPDFTYDRNKGFRRWLRTVAHNYWRNLKRKRAGEPDRVHVEMQELEDGADPFWEEEYRQRLVSRAMQVMRNDFAETTWQACWKLVVEGMTAASVAKELGMTIGAVHVAKSRVLARLRQELEGLLE